MVRVRPHPAQLALAVVASGAEGQTGARRRTAGGIDKARG
jgi:hypothetical protein